LRCCVRAQARDNRSDRVDSQMRILSAEQLTKCATQIFVAAGVQEQIAVNVVESLVLSNLLGVDSHGVVRIKNYLDSIKRGAIVPSAIPEVGQESGSAAFIYGRHAFGQIVARFAAEKAIAKACETGIGVSVFTDVYHIGRLGEYVEIASDRGMIALMMANGSRPGGLVAPFGGRERRLGTNPIAFSVPAGREPALIADFSTAAVAEGRVRVSARKNERLPRGLLIDQNGNPTDVANDLYAGGAILTFGGYKGYALSLLVEVIGGILSGAETPIFSDYDYMHNGVFMLVVDPTFFRKNEEYLSSVDFLFGALRNTRSVTAGNEVLIPGEPERRRRAEREKTGIPIDDETWKEILESAESLNLTLEEIGICK
jgi:hydroxycarboxylate dehydrogenase B